MERLLADPHSARVDVGDGRAGADLDAPLLQGLPGVVAQVLRKGRQNARSRLDQDHARLTRIDAPEVRGQGLTGDVGDGAGHLHPRRAAADDDEGGQVAAFVVRVGQLRLLEGHQDAPANLRGVFQPLQARREGRPFLMSEIGVGGAGGEHEPVVGEVPARGDQPPSGPIDPLRLGHVHLSVLLASQHPSDRPGDIGRRQRRGRHLIEQGLERLVVLAVDHHHLDRRLGQGLGRLHACEASAGDDHTGRPGSNLRHRDLQECRA
ncbi:MAG: hypothetical protein A2882_10510 [Phenylobacterium sp. RIFCSPHIGHO2_01_FULL_70_10]|nr:MAG: hypothetical protein A2882_10510 [Phenylobacterium sp. RIFCSPHIGHO2_01_FULL_70_10]